MAILSSMVVLFQIDPFSLNQCISNSSYLFNYLHWFLKDHYSATWIFSAIFWDSLAKIYGFWDPQNSTDVSSPCRSEIYIPMTDLYGTDIIYQHWSWNCHVWSRRSSFKKKNITLGYQCVESLKFPGEFITKYWIWPNYNISTNLSFPEIFGGPISLTKPPAFGMRSCEVNTQLQGCQSIRWYQLPACHLRRHLLTDDSILSTFPNPQRIYR